MKMKIDGGNLIVADMDSTQYAIIKSWNMTRYNKSQKWIEGPVTLEFLDKMASIVRLPELIEAERQRIGAVRRAVDAERLRQEPVPLYDFPVKIPLFQHQIRGANMALLTFGLIAPERVRKI